MGISRLTRRLASRGVFFVLATFGMLYFSYKYYTPWMGGNDYARYYAMYLHPLDFTQAPAPFIYRQISAVITWLLLKSRIYVPLEIAFTTPEYDQRVFFAALLANYIGLWLTALMVSCIIDDRLGERRVGLPILGGLLCYLSVFSQQGVLTGLTEGWSWFLFALGLSGYLRRRLWIVIPALMLALFQRETIPLIFFVMALVDMALAEKGQRRFYGSLALASGSALLLYIVLRRVLLPVPGYEWQIDLPSILRILQHAWPPSSDLFVQGILSQNVIFLYLGLSIWVVLVQVRSGLRWRDALRQTSVVSVATVLCVLWGAGIAVGIGNNIGRIAAVMTPAAAAYIPLRLSDLESRLRVPDV